MSEISSHVPMANVPVAAPPEISKLPPREWMKENLFSSPFNSVLTVATTIFLLAVFRGLLSFIFNPIRQWDSTATNLQLFMTRAYPDEQYIRIWFCVAVILILTGVSMAVWRAGSTMPVATLGHKLMGAGAFLALLALLAPFSTSATIQWLAAAVAVAAVGEAVRRFAGRGGTDRTVSTLTVLVVTLAGTVAVTTKLPWTIMLMIVVAAYFAGRLMRDRLPANPIRAALVVLWLLAPFFLVYLVLRDPDFDMGHVFSTDLPIFLAYAVGGAALLSWLTRPSTGETGRIVAVLVLVAGFCTFLTPMRQVVRLDMLLLAVFALAAPTFAGGPRARRRYIFGWLGVLGVMSRLITSINTPSTVTVPGGFFIGGFSITLFVAVIALVISFPLGIALALARTSSMPIFRQLATGFIEVVRGVPLITVLIFFSIMVPLFLPRGMHLGEVAAVVIGYVLFSSAYLAENVRGGLQSVTRGQHEAAEAVGMTTAQKTVFIVLPQALRVSIPPLVGHCIGVFKETSLLAIIGVFDLLYIGRIVIPGQTEFMGSTRESLLFVSVIYWIFAYQMSKASQRLERRTGLGER